MRNFFYLALLGVALLTIAIVVRSGSFARKNSGRPINSAMREAMNAESPQLNTDDAMLIAKTYGSARQSATGLRWVERATGSGDGHPRIGGEVIAHYDGRLLDGTPFDSSYKRGVPLTFRVGIGQVIRGWDEAFLTMKKGEKRTLIIPHWLGYGEKGSPPAIPPRATLVFEVELLDFR
ncbi:MAG TPA: FKBP-type peptidyl-prolyl cis-trans isomerase [Opitutaceae bacterium]|nr:FKBP-type peptidyl-prolyl cis-trans isomerase [Opitutaceae bacterium]